MNDEQQGKLLEGYLLALRTNASALPPPGLDPDLAALARKIASRKSLAPDAATRDRVWQRALATAQSARAQANGRHHVARHQEDIMIATQRAPVAPKATHSLTLIAALVVVLAGALLLFGRPPAGEGPTFPAALSNPEQQQDSTATQTPVPSPTMVGSLAGNDAPIMHVVREGETLLSILQLYGYTDLNVLDQIIALNSNVTNTGELPPAGQTILIPRPPATPTMILTSTPFPASTIVPASSPLPPTLEPYFTAPQQNLTVVPGVTGEPCIDWRPTVDAPYLPTVPQQTPTAVLSRPDGIQVEQQPTVENMLIQTVTPSMMDPLEPTPTSSPLPPAFVAPEQNPAVIPVTIVPGTAGEPCIEWLPTAMPPMIIPTSGEPIAYGDTVEGRLNAENPAVYYRFEANEGDVVTLRVAGEDSLDTRVALTHEAGFFHQ